MDNLKFSEKNKDPDYFSEQVAVAKRFYRNLGTPLTTGISVIAGGREKCAPGYRIKRETFPFYSIEFVAAGTGELVLGNKKYPLSPGAIFAYGPDIPHSIYSLEEEPLVKYFVNFRGEEAKKTLSDYSLLGRVLHTSSPKRILDTFDEITYYGLTHSTASETICATLLKLLILKISETAITQGEASSPAFATYQRCRNLINNRYMRLKSLNEISKIAHIDSAYLCRLFKRFDEQTPYQYLLNLKMNYAAELLLKPGVLIKEVADKLGFDNQFHFSRTFKKVYGISPVKFGKIHFS